MFLILLLLPSMLYYLHLKLKPHRDKSENIEFIKALYPNMKYLILVIICYFHPCSIRVNYWTKRNNKLTSDSTRLHTGLQATILLLCHPCFTINLRDIQTKRNKYQEKRVHVLNTLVYVGRFLGILSNKRYIIGWGAINDILSGF